MGLAIRLKGSGDLDCIFLYREKNMVGANRTRYISPTQRERRTYLSSTIYYKLNILIKLIQLAIPNKVLNLLQLFQLNGEQPIGIGIPIRVLFQSFSNWDCNTFAEYRGLRIPYPD